MSPWRLLPILTLLLLLGLSDTASTATFLLPLIKDRARLQYYTTFTLGTPPVRVSLTVDLGNPTNWISGSLAGYNKSSSYKPVITNTPDGNAYCGPDPAHSGTSGDCSQASSPMVCNSFQCWAWATNPTHPHLAGLGTVVLDALAPLYRRPSPSTAPVKTSLPLFPLVDTDWTSPLKGLSQFTKGILSLSRTPIALPFQVSSTFNVPRKFAVCLPSSAVNGAVYFGGGPYVLPPSTVDLATSFASTPLVSNAHSVIKPYDLGDPAGEYYIKINSIRIDGSPVKFNSSLLTIDGNGDGGSRLTTMVYYTRLRSEIYTAFVDVFVQKAKALNMAAVGPVSSFKTCFNSTSIKYNARTGSGVPVIELVMAGNASWRIFGSNSLVKVSSDVHCLAIFDAGPKTTDEQLPAAALIPAVEIGAKQMEDNLVEFDLEAFRVGVSSSLQRFGTSCSQFKGI